MSGNRSADAGAAGASGDGVLFEARDLRKSYRRGPEEVRALAGVTFALRVGEVVALVGPSGSGKTTLLNVICGWEHPEAGEVTWAGDGGGASASDREGRRGRARREGREVPPVAPERRPWSDLAIVPQDLGLLEELSVLENVELPLRLSHRLDSEGRARAVGFLEEFGLVAYSERRPGEISLGEQQRVALARAMVIRPRLLLADEPTGHQDEGWAREVFRAFRESTAAGTTCLVATHSQEFLKHVDRVLSIRDGRIEADSTAG
ncbi:MAG: ATP-binding cassette domain-containing protein [Actinomycetota bacterium]|nr:ATP-binding cassette domain-containing protein [Actinomycetota bacterium]